MMQVAVVTAGTQTSAPVKSPPPPTQHHFSFLQLDALPCHPSYSIIALKV